jgi:hypothetical protein
MAVNSRKIMLALAIVVACGGIGHKAMAQFVPPPPPNLPPPGGKQGEDRGDDRDGDNHGGRWR